MTTEAPPAEQPSAEPAAEQLDTNSEIQRFRLNLEGIIRLHAHLPLALIVGQLIVTANDLQANTRAAQNREAMRRHMEAQAAKIAAATPPEAKTGPTGIVPRTGGKGRNGKKRR